MKNINYQDIKSLDVEIFPKRHSGIFFKILSSLNPCSRLNEEGHITASGLVIRNGRALLIFHPYIREWMQPGGHIDAGETPIDAAIREVYEETGVICKPIERSLDPIDIDLHEIPANPKKGEAAHLHIDFLFLFEAAEEGESPEEIPKAWLPFEEISSARLKRAIKKLQNEA